MQYLSNPHLTICYLNVAGDVPDFFDLAAKKLPNLAGVKYTTTDMTSLNIMHSRHPTTNLLMGTDEVRQET